MLACAQDIFFNTEPTHSDQYSNNNDCQQQLKDKCINKLNNALQLQQMQQMQSNQHDHHTANNKEKEEQQVWPPDVEAAFIKALETIPKLGRRKILVNGKPCGRNELISDFIFRKTGKIRTRKQVSSHIQVLKNTRKGNPHFMRLLTDSVEDEGFASSQHRKPSNKTNSIARRNNKMNSINSAESLSSDESSMSSSSSPADYVFDIMYHHEQQQQQNSLSMLDIKDPFYEPFFGSLDISTSTPNNNYFNANMQQNAGMVMSANLNAFTLPSNATATDVLQQIFPTDPNNLLGMDINLHSPQQQQQADFFQQQQQQQQRQQGKKGTKKSSKKYTKKQKNMMKAIDNHHASNSMSFGNSSMNDLTPSCSSTANAISGNNNVWIDPSVHPLWPNYICLYLEYSLPYDPSITIPHTLATLPECIPSLIPPINASLVAKNKCPMLSELIASPISTILSARVKLNLNLNMTDFFFNNTSFFETQERRTIECTTTIYSFGNVVLESKEIQQALWLNEGKYMYSFVYVNQFFDAFMKGIRSLQSWEEVDIAINNLCVVQVFEDVESKFTTNPSTATTTGIAVSQDDMDIQTDTTTMPSMSESSPLLAMVYEFERGQGTMEMSCITDSSLLAPTITPTAKEFDFLASVSNNTVSEM